MIRMPSVGKLIWSISCPSRRERQSPTKRVCFFRFSKFSEIAWRHLVYGREYHHALRRAWSGACKVLYATNLQNQVVYSTYPRIDFDQASLGGEELLQNSLQDPRDNRVYFGDTGMPLKRICGFAAFRLFGIMKRKKCLGFEAFR